MNKFVTSEKSDNYEAEIVEDIPEQFDLSRYKSKTKPSPMTYRSPNYVGQAPTQPAQQPQGQLTSYQNTTNSNSAHSSGAITLPPNGDRNDYKLLTAYDYNYSKIKSAANDSGSQSNSSNYGPQQPQNYQLNYSNQIANYNYLMNSNVHTPQYPSSKNQYYNQNLDSYGGQYISQGNSSSSTQVPYNQVDSLRKKSTSSVKPNEIEQAKVEPQRHTRHNSNSNSVPPRVPRAKSDERKKSSFADEDDNESLSYQKKDYFLKGGDDLSADKKWLTRENNDATKSASNASLSDITAQIDVPELTSLPIKSIIKPAIKKTGVTFDEKLEVYEVKNPHYGQEVKTEKREMKKKKRDRQKEEEIVLKTKLDMKSKMQSQMGYYEVRNILN